MNNGTILKKSTAVFLALTMAIEAFIPTAAYALTSGPSTPEVTGFESMSTSEMVNAFTGDFSYSIPLLDVGGYPVNLSYHSGVGMEDEASWVGLGWNLNVGSVNRQLRGIPDDFNGDKIKRHYSSNPTWTMGIGYGPGVEIAGLANASVGVLFKYNNYEGFSWENSANVTASIVSSNVFGDLTAGLSLHSSSDGLDIKPEVSLEKKTPWRFTKKGLFKSKTSIGLSTTFNTRYGLESMNFSVKRTTDRFNLILNKNKTNFRKVDTSKEGTLLSCPINFAGDVFAPQIELPYHNYAASFTAKLGFDVFVVDGHEDFTGMYSRQSLAQNMIERSAYGYIFSDAGQSDNVGMLDFSRENDGAWTDHTSDLPFSFFSYDKYNVSADGLQAEFRPIRNDIGYSFDMEVGTSGWSSDLGEEFSVGNLFKYGHDIDLMFSSSKSQKWVDKNYVYPVFSFSPRQETDREYEPYAFLNESEMFQQDMGLLNELGGRDPKQFYMSGGVDEFDFPIYNSFASDISVNHSNNKRNIKQRRSTLFSSIARKDYDNFSLTKAANLFPNTNNKLDNHIAEISVLKPDGTRYVYGIAAYNSFQKDVTFSVNPANVTATGVGYDGFDNSLKNEQGDEHYYDMTEMPAYSYSHLLTSILSPDYVDLTMDGPTSDDLGSYTIFKYYKSPDNFKWRTPYGSEAALDFGKKSIPGDDKGTLQYGEKEIYYLEFIETKNHIAQFNTEDRFDGHGCTENNGIDSDSKVQRLKSIVLKAKDSGRILKQVFFTYSYSLCPGVPNNNVPTSGGGKLTLDGIYFSFGEEPPIFSGSQPPVSATAKLSPYTFHYCYDNTDYNKGYSYGNYDRWGTYNEKHTTDVSQIDEFPYTKQGNREEADIFASQWSLTSIDLPSGGTIKINYEADDYAYVQDKRAMQMYKIEGCGSSDNFSNSQNFRSSISSCDNTIFFKLMNATSDMDEALKEVNNCKEGINDLYFDFNIKVNQNTMNLGKEHVRGYIPKIDPDDHSVNFEIGLANPSSGGTYEYGFIRLLEVFDGFDNAIVRAAHQYSAIHTPKQAFAFGTVDDGNLIDGFLNILYSSLANPTFYLPRNNQLQLLELGYNFDLNSWIKLNSPTRCKIGGGSRVKRIEIHDNWAHMTNIGGPERSKYYGQEYIYKVEDKDTHEIISSGVASFEPLMGGDENALIKPVYTHQDALLGTGDDYFTEEPFGKGYYPSPVVGYGSVIIRNISGFSDTGDNHSKKHGSGYIIKEYYTSKDFPTKSSHTSAIPMPRKSGFWGTLFKFNYCSYMNVTEGFSLQVNDMHGKEKAIWNYSEEANWPNTSQLLPNKEKLISGVEYKYKSNGDRLDNLVKLVNADGTISTDQTMGVNYDISIDMREQNSNTQNYGLQMNLSDFLFIWGPIAIPFILPKYHHENTRFRSCVLNKIIFEHGILEETKVYDLGSSISSKNLAYDAITCAPILAETKNEFNDFKYSFNYPAHWAYEGMGPAYRNIDNLLIVDVDVDGKLSIDPADTYYMISGDQVKVAGSSGTITETESYWVVNKNGDFYLLDKDGNKANTSAVVNLKMRVLRSGSRNMQAMSIGGNITSVNPIRASGSTEYFDFRNILSAGANEYSDEWKTFCECGIVNSADPNPYQTGSRGCWRLKKSYSYLAHRQQSNTNNNTGIRTDGTYDVFTPFWSQTGASTPFTFSAWNKPTDLEIGTPSWTWVTENTLYSPYGFGLEEKNILGNYSAAQYNYNNTLPSALGKNMMYREIGFDGFEDNPCDLSHFKFSRNAGFDVTNTQHHSGRYSIKIEGGQESVIEKQLNNCNIGETFGPPND